MRENQRNPFLNLYDNVWNASSGVVIQLSLGTTLLLTVIIGIVSARLMNCHSERRLEISRPVMK